MLSLVLIASVLVWVFRKPIGIRLVSRSILANEAPPVSVLEEMIAEAPSRTAAIVEAWNTDRIVHREVAVREIGRNLSTTRPLPSELEAILLSGALDPDQNVREASLRALLACNHPALPAVASHQLGNPDPELRRLGLDVLRRVPGVDAPPVILPLLDDPQPDIAALALHVLGRLSGRDFGVKLSDTVAVENEQSGGKEFKPESFEKVRTAAAAAKSWFRRPSSLGPGNPPSLPEVAVATRRRIPAGDFVLVALDGVRFRLSEARGKVVLIHFWTTWCSACLGEMAALNELHERHRSRVVILGISLDNLTDSHGHTGGHSESLDTTEAVDPAHDGHDHPGERSVPSFAEIRRRVEATVKRRNVAYPVLIDADNEVGSRFNGGELPTTVIVDGDGFVRRRFVGPRSVEVLEAMIQEAAGPDRLTGARTP